MTTLPASAPAPNTTVPPAAEGAEKDQPLKDAAEFAWRVHGYTNEYVRFADGKAGVVIAWCAALVGALFTARAHFYFLVWPDFSRAAWGPTFLGAGSILSFGLLIMGILCGVGAIVPRLRSRPDANKTWLERLQQWRSIPAPAVGLIYWDQVLAHGNQDAYWKNLSGQQVSQLGRAVTDHVFTLAQIANEKYRCIKWSIIFAFWGSLAALIMLVLASCWPPA